MHSRVYTLSNRCTCESTCMHAHTSSSSISRVISSGLVNYKERFSLLYPAPPPLFLLCFVVILFPRLLSFGDAYGPHGGGGMDLHDGDGHRRPVSLSSSITFACYKKALAWKSTLFFILEDPLKSRFSLFYRR